MKINHLEEFDACIDCNPKQKKIFEELLLKEERISNWENRVKS